MQCGGVCLFFPLWIVDATTPPSPPRIQSMSSFARGTVECFVTAIESMSCILGTASDECAFVFSNVLISA